MKFQFNDGGRVAAGYKGALETVWFAPWRLQLGFRIRKSTTK
jgi:hypothetical protein